MIQHSETKSLLHTPSISIPFETKVLRMEKVRTPFFFRPNTSDEAVIITILANEDYLLPIKNYQPKLIIDCGANIGCATVYFANKYPDAQIYSVEPERDNFLLFRYNTAFYDNVHGINSALWDKETFIRVEDRGFGNWGFMTFETTPDDRHAFKTTTISKILAKSKLEEIDILKIDIEGAEKEVFDAPDVDEWLSKVKVLIIELHDHMKRGCSYPFFKAISKYKCFFSISGQENLIFIRENLIF